jgi:CRISPR/Cas system-associated endonuclease Cas3-HD
MAKKMIPLNDGGLELRKFLEQYRAQFFQDSSTQKGHVYWSAPVSQWILVMRKGNKAQVTFHPADDCPCKLI